MKRILRSVLLMIAVVALWTDSIYAEGVKYSVPVKVVKASDRTQESMGAKAVDSNITVIEDNGKYRYIIKTKELEAKGLRGHLTNLIYKDGGKREELKKLSAEGIYTNNYELVLNDRKNEITFAVWVDAMDELMGAGPGSGEQDVVFILSWNDAKSINSSARDNGELKIKVNGREISSDVKPYIKKGRTMVPVRFVSEAIGLNVQWNSAEQKVLISDGGESAELKIGSNSIKKGELEKTIDAPAEIKDGRTFVPVRAISEIFDAEVGWNQNERTVSIKK